MASTSTSASARRCLTAWKLPIGCPNWRRTFAYSTLISSTRAGRAEQLCRRGGRRAIEYEGRGPEATDPPGGRRVERQPGERPGPVHRRLRRRPLRVTERECVDPVVGGHDGEVRHRRVLDRLGPSDRAATGLPRIERWWSRPPRPHSRWNGLPTAAADPAGQLLAHSRGELVVAPSRLERPEAEHGRDEGSRCHPACRAARRGPRPRPCPDRGRRLPRAARLPASPARPSPPTARGRRARQQLGPAPSPSGPRPDERADPLARGHPLEQVGRGLCAARAGRQRARTPWRRSLGSEPRQPGPGPDRARRGPVPS